MIFKLIKAEQTAQKSAILHNKMAANILRKPTLQCHKYETHWQTGFFRNLYPLDLQQHNIFQFSILFLKATLTNMNRCSTQASCRHVPVHVRNVSFPYTIKKKKEKLAWLLVLIEADNHEADAQPPAALPAIPASTSSCQHVSADARVNKGGICFHEIPRYRLNFFGDSACPQQKLKIPHLDWQRSNPPPTRQSLYGINSCLNGYYLFSERSQPVTPLVAFFWTLVIILCYFNVSDQCISFITWMFTQTAILPHLVSFSIWHYFPPIALSGWCDLQLQLPPVHWPLCVCQPPALAENRIKCFPQLIAQYECQKKEESANTLPQPSY